MRIERVTIESFGPFENAQLEFAEGLTLVYGGNETGKSTWHAALFAGLCGMRRGRGRPRIDDQRFADLHRPWDAPGWTVGCVARLDDGRRVELRQDLEGKVDCRATDLDLGTDLSSDIIHEGSPDGSRWLGLDRRSFAATACVGQADILSLLADPDALQEHIQRAAATAGADETAAAALDLLDEFASECVGLDRANSTKPLRRGKDELEEARRLAGRSREQHDEYLRLVAEANDLRDVEAQSLRSLRAAESIAAEQAAASAAERLEEARGLSAQFPDGPPPDLDSDDAIAQGCSAALAEWDSRPVEAVIDGPGADDIVAKLALLPETPTGDLSPDDAVTDAFSRFRMALMGLQAHAETAPPQQTGRVVDSTPEQLIELAHALDLGPTAAVLPEPPGDGASWRGTVRSRAHWITSVGAASVGVIAAVVVVVVGQPVVGVALALAGLAVAALLWSRASAHSQPAVAETAAVERNAAARMHYSQAMATTAQLGIDQTPQAIREALATLLSAEQERNALLQWKANQTQRQTHVNDSEETLRTALAARGASDEASGVAGLFETYVTACQQRLALANQAARREDLANQLTAAQRAAEAADSAREARERAAERIHSAAGRCGVVGVENDTIVSGLRTWQAARAAALAGQAERARSWARLQAALGQSGSLENLAFEVERVSDTANVASAGVTDEDRAIVRLGDDPEATLVSLRDGHTAALERAATAQGRANDRAQSLPSVPEAEERLARAEAAVANVESLRETLTQARDFLAKAQERVHRDIAPVLAKAVQRGLPDATGGRYSDVVVDPATLNVKVCGQKRRWREARLLSHGTREQVYLLLRIALADHLARAAERCPLIFDDVTVHSDAIRREAMLGLLLDFAAHRQVILFSQEAEVLDWCKLNTASPRHAILMLTGPVAE